MNRYNKPRSIRRPGAPRPKYEPIYTDTKFTGIGADERIFTNPKPSAGKKLLGIAVFAAEIGTVLGLGGLLIFGNVAPSQATLDRIAELTPKIKSGPQHEQPTSYVLENAEPAVKTAASPAPRVNKSWTPLAATGNGSYMSITNGTTTFIQTAPYQPEHTAERLIRSHEQRQENQRLLAEIEYRDRQCSWWKNRALNYDVITIRDNVERYCRN